MVVWLEGVANVESNVIKHVCSDKPFTIKKVFITRAELMKLWDSDRYLSNGCSILDGLCFYMIKKEK